ncbi:MAG: STAS domain-containing protein [Vitreoscilla sp.]|nr:STAS domain-containing protein [Vitreoscilla sp.]
MTNGTDNKGILSRVVRSIAGPARDLMARGEDSRLSQYDDSDRAELKAMIERKRRNDFVRKRELDMLRRIRREGLTPEQAAALNANSRLDESDVRGSHPSGLPDRGVKAKIDAIEKQMVGVAPIPGMRPGPPGMPPPVPAPAPLKVQPPVLTNPIDADATVPLDLSLDKDPAAFINAAVVEPPPPQPTRPAPPAEPPKQPSAASPGPISARMPLVETAEVEVREIPYDPELDEAVIAFANADFTHAERLLLQHTGHGGARQAHEDTWMVLFDLYRATGQQQGFESLALRFAEQIGRSPPQWYSLPKLLSDASTAKSATGTNDIGQVGWVCPPRLDTDSLTLLASQLLQLPQPWVLDWTQLKRIEPAAAAGLRKLFQQWAAQPVQMRWLAADRLFDNFQEAAPVGVRDADPAFWLARLDALRLVNRPDQFDDVAIDYCVTYEVSPPSWESTRCTVRLSGPAANTRSAVLSSIGDAVTSLIDAPDGRGEIEVTTLEISGQLAGDQATLLAFLNAKLGDSKVLRVSCALLIRVDFVAAGDLLNWVIAKHAEGRQVTFFDVNRLVALMFGAMGINEHVVTQLRRA